MIDEVIVIDVAVGESRGRLLVEKPKKRRGIQFTLVAAGRAIEFVTNETETHELQKAIEILTPEREE